MLSIALATHNEEKLLATCLESIRDIADEIVIADGESTDGTLEIAKKYKAKVIATTNKSNFHINKQMAIDAAKGDLILQLDADEVVDETMKKFILKIHKQVQAGEYDTSQPVAWWLKRKNFFLGSFLKKGGQYPDPVIRLFLAKKAYLPQKDVHEQMEVNGEIGWADGHLLHYGNPTFSDYLMKFNRYTSFKAGQLQEQHLTVSLASAIEYIVIKPVTTFLSLFLRHKGFVDGVAGFVFALMSGLHHAVAYIKLWELKETKKYAK